MGILSIPLLLSRGSLGLSLRLCLRLCLTLVSSVLAVVGILSIAALGRGIRALFLLDVLTV